MFTATVFEIVPNWLTFPSNDHQTITVDNGAIFIIFIHCIIM